MRTQRGFTLLEMVLAVGILAIIFSLGLGIVSMVQKTTARQGAKTMEQIFQTAALRARDGVNGSAWGVYVPYNEITREAGQAILFSGASYAARNAAFDVAYPVSSGLHFTSFKNTPISAGNDHEAVFSFLTGQTVAAGSLVLDFFGESLTITFSSTGLPVSDSL